ncbi:hypothetical protein [Thermodesulforhabdus norvegica]|uniref:Histone methylation protein DOT1 n=1 Tax=Thermodesulforhabdus norvegica TaxID=39841 RepID=A0A1I4T7N4_9BACT|nr:hypothetical protein [Thermodesulforhabdus norvegica]SFM72798.1 Histone methylation protein DOT1 [Thermodesulforhabdus norvegica]
MDRLTCKTLQRLAEFLDARKVGHVGNSGYRKTSDMAVLLKILERLIDKGIVVPKKTVFLDMGSGDGRVNIFMAYVCRWSLGFEIEDFIYDEYLDLKGEIASFLKMKGLKPLPDTLKVWCGDSLDERSHRKMSEETGVTLADVDIFYTYITMHDLFADFLREKARSGAYYMVYGFNGILPRYRGFELVDPDVAGQKIVTLYRKL